MAFKAVERAALISRENDILSVVFRLYRCSEIKTRMDSRRDLIDSIDEKGIPPEILEDLRELRLYGLLTGQESGGQGMSMTETSRLLEELSEANLSLAESVSVSNTLGVRALEKFGSDEAKAKYLPMLCSGEWTGAFCMADEAGGTDPTVNSVSATYDPYTERYLLSGTKTWVTNASTASLFTVFANVRVKNEVGSKVPQATGFLVEKSMPGVRIGEKKTAKIGMKGLDVREVVFDKVELGESHVLGTPGRGPEVITSTVIPMRMFTGAKACGALRRLIDSTTRHCMEHKAFGKPLIHSELVNWRLARSAQLLYALEAVTYMTAGLADVQLKPDVEVESCMTRLFAIRASREILQNCLRLWGSRALVRGSGLGGLARDLEALELWEGTEDILKMSVAMPGVLHAQMVMMEEWSGWQSPAKHLRQAAYMFRQWRDIQGTRMGLNHSVHPSLKDPADILEHCVHRVRNTDPLSARPGGQMPKIHPIYVCDCF